MTTCFSAYFDSRLRTCKSSTHYLPIILHQRYIWSNGNWTHTSYKTLHFYVHLLVNTVLENKRCLQRRGVKGISGSLWVLMQGFETRPADPQRRPHAVPTKLPPTSHSRVTALPKLNFAGLKCEIDRIIHIYVCTSAFVKAVIINWGPFLWQRVMRPTAHIPATLRHKEKNNSPKEERHKVDWKIKKKKNSTNSGEIPESFFFPLIDSMQRQSPWQHSSTHCKLLSLSAPSCSAHQQGIQAAAAEAQQLRYVTRLMGPLTNGQRGPPPRPTSSCLRSDAALNVLLFPF